jgi:TrpR-related protein YerC/YecD
METGDPAHPWLTDEIEELSSVLAGMRSVDETERFLRDLCTLSELEAMAHRWQVAKLLDEGLPYQEVARRTRASTTTVTRVAQWLKRGEGGYRLALDRQRRRSTGRSRTG